MIYKKKNDLEWNIKTHNKIAKKYEKIHGEIYNEVEQKRLRNQLSFAISNVQTDGDEKLVLDFGCGSGNLTHHLSSLGYNVLASDISQGFLDLVASKSDIRKVKTIQLNGFDLSNISDNSVDMVATYSVLHHVPDYLAILKEFMRVLKTGGVVFIDHESSDGFWKKDPVYIAFHDEMKTNTTRDLSKYFLVKNYYDWLVRRFINPKYHREGDIHVFEDDHIEWANVVNELMENGGSLVYEEDYLLYRRNYDSAIYAKYVNRTSDMHILVMRKQSI